MQKLFISIIQGFIDLIVVTLNFIFGMLPTSPFTLLRSSPFASLLAQINYFIPVYEFVVILEAWLVAVGVFYVYSIIARWLKAIN